MDRKLSDKPPQLLKTVPKRLCIVVLFSIAFGYIEAAVVVYLRAIFHPDGFTFPLTDFGAAPLWQQLLLTEVGREAATLVLMLTGAWLIGRNLRLRFAFFLTIFAVWDISYYVWLKVLINWPASLMDWDILFLIPATWAGPVLAPILVSITLFAFAVIILSRFCLGRPLEPALTDWFGFVFAALVVVVSFCVAGRHIKEPDFQSHFYWPLFGIAHISAIILFLKCLLRSK